MNELALQIAGAVAEVSPERRDPPHHLRLVHGRRQALAQALSDYYAHTPQRIPRVIHQIWIGPRRPPWKWIATFRDRLAREQPHWQHRLWREPEIDALPLAHREHYLAEPTLHGKADLLRYEILQQLGGVYVDADMVWLGKSLDPLLEEAQHAGFFVGRECSISVANSVIGCAPQHPLIDLIVRSLGKLYGTLRQDLGLAPWQATGPRFLTEVLQDLPCCVFPATYFYPVSWHGLDPAVDAAQFSDSYMLQYGYSTNHLSVD